MEGRSSSKKRKDKERPVSPSQGNGTESFELRSVRRACRKYDAALRRGLLPLRADGDTEAQLAHYRTCQERLARRSTEIRQLLWGLWGQVLIFDYLLRIRSLLFCRRMAVSTLLQSSFFAVLFVCPLVRPETAYRSRPFASGSDGPSFAPLPSSASLSA